MIRQNINKLRFYASCENTQVLCMDSFHLFKNYKEKTKNETIFLKKIVVFKDGYAFVLKLTFVNVR